MSTALAKFIEKVRSDSTLQAEVQALDSVEAIVKLGATHGFIFTEDEYMAEIQGSGELSDDEAAAIFGGTGAPPGTGFGSCPCSWQD